MFGGLFSLCIAHSINSPLLAQVARGKGDLSFPVDLKQTAVNSQNIMATVSEGDLSLFTAAV